MLKSAPHSFKEQSRVSMESSKDKPNDAAKSASPYEKTEGLTGAEGTDEGIKGTDEATEGTDKGAEGTERTAQAKSEEKEEKENKQGSPERYHQILHL